MVSVAGAGRRAAAPRLGLRQNLPQFLLLVGVNGLVGASLGQERIAVPLLAEHEFGVSSYAGMLTFVAAFGLSKAITNLAAGALADRWGRRPVLLAGWVAALPVPLLLLWAPSWTWVVAANVLLGVSQGLAWSLTVVMKIDLAGPARRGLAMGLNEAAGYGAIAAAAWATAAAAESWGLRTAPFVLGLGVAIAGLAISALFVRETRGHVALEAAGQRLDRGLAGADGAGPTVREVFARSTWRDPTLSAASRAGLVNNLNEGVAWGLFPLLFAGAGLPVGQVGLLVALAPGVWAAGQLLTGPLSDRVGRKGLIVTGQAAQAAGLAVIALGTGMGPWAAGSALLGAGTAMAYPTLLAAVGDAAGPRWRATAVGVYRLWRDAGFAVGAVVGGLLADAYSIPVAILAVAVATAASAGDVALGMRETGGRPARPGAAAGRAAP